MKKSSLQITKKENFIAKIKHFILNIFNTTSQNKSIEIKNYNSKPLNKSNDFLNNLKIQRNFEKEKLINIQNKIEKGILNKEIVFNLTKDLSEKEIENLKLLYHEQIFQLELELQNYKNTIKSSKKIPKNN